MKINRQAALHVDNTITTKKTANVQCIHVANGSSRHYRVCHGFLELPKGKEHKGLFKKTHKDI